MREIVYLDGQFVDRADARVSVEDRGYQFADGIYEVVRFHGRRGLRFDEHLARLQRSADHLRIQGVPTAAEWHETINQLMELCEIPDDDSAVNCLYQQITRGDNPRNHVFPKTHISPVSVAYFRPDTLPADFQSELTVTRHYTPRQYGFTFTNGIQGSYVEVDPDTGFIKLLGHWCVEDSGTVINPMLVDEQLRGGIAQGIGAALYEECLYDADGQLLNGNMADYLVPMAGEMPDIVCAHVETPTKQSQLGAKGVGEAGTAGAPGAVMNAVNDALAPLGARVTAMPFTPERVLQALKKV